MRSKLTGAKALFLAFGISIATSSCSAYQGGDSHVVNEDPHVLALRDSVDRVGWQWSPGGDEEVISVHPLPVGVAVILGDGVVALSGETGEVVWEYRNSEENFTGGISGDGDYLVLEAQVSGGDGYKFMLLDPETGQMEHDILIDIEEVESYSYLFRESGAHIALMSDRVRVVGVAEENGDAVSLSAFSLSGGEEVWSGPGGISCDSGKRLRLSAASSVLVGDVLVVPYTCAEFLSNEEIEEAGEAVGNQEMSVGLLGVGVQDGRELWRLEEEHVGVVNDSYGREFIRLNQGHVSIHSQRLESMVVDVRDGRVVMEGANVLAAAEDMSWTVQTQGRGTYVRMNEKAREVGRVEIDDEGSRDEDYQVAVLERAIVVSGSVGAEENSWATVREWGGGAEEIGSGMDFSDYRVNKVISVPGAVVVSHGGGEGESGLVGLH
ncbi:PQQ-binding-like beta-propeller repeat protein [Nocardiopsis alborubida]|uniref:PQQ-binding-like beta-propeller repeat protein n=1 Tax=Nocardiopsis alborubida TaxID=146802 RepID=A0A7X6MFC2_9ACTN|nr:PQQ-binding-like beta-propeller repeat protein [Nocardiopsis alborubida]NKZ00252.1 PQQ-binding-like beta-propeller repeat protein [Nocardiopsis alborubida]